MRWAREANWGSLPPSPEWHCIPIQSGMMTLKAGASLFWPPTSFTDWKRSVLLQELQEVAGRIEVLAWPEPTGYLLDAALQRDGDHDLSSYSVDYFTPPDPRRCRGVVVEGLRIRADRESVALLPATRAWKEEDNDALTEDDFDYSGVTPVPFRLCDALISLDGSELSDVEEFAITVDNAVEAGPNAGGHVSFLLAGRRSVSLIVTKLNNTDDFNAAIRSGAALSFGAHFTHPDGHEMTLELPVLRPERSDEDGEPSRVARSSTMLQAATDETGRELIYEVNLSGGTTTTTSAS